MSTPQSPIAKPGVVTTAIVLLCLSLAIVMAGLFLLWFHHSPVGSTIFTLLVMSWLTYKIDRGRNWARITFLVLYILGGAVSIPMLLLVPSARIYGGAFIIQAVLQAIALVRLFSRTARPWFRPVAAQSTA